MDKLIYRAMIKNVVTTTLVANVYIYIYIQTLVLSFPGLISVAQVNE